MKVRVDLAALRFQVNAVTEVCAKSGVLSGVLLTANQSNVTVTATDLSVTLQAQVPAEVKEMGNLLVNGRHLSQALNGGEDVMVELIGGDDRSLSIKGMRGVMKLLGTNPQDFPTVPDVGAKGVTLAAPELASDVERALPILTSTKSSERFDAIEVTALEDRVRVTATDSHRIMVLEHPAQGAEAMGTVMISPAGARALLTTAAGAVMMEHGSDETHCWFTAGGRTVRLRRPEVKLPDVMRVMGGEDEVSVVMDQAALSKAVQRAITFANIEGFAVKATVEGQALTLYVFNDKIGSSNDANPVDEAKGEGSILLNAAYLRVALAAMKKFRRVRLGWIRDKRVTLTPVLDDGDDGFLRRFLMAPIFG